MSDEGLSKLKIQKSEVVYQKSKRKKIFYTAFILAILVVLSLLFAKGLLSPAVEVQVTAVGTTYLSQCFTLLNASGYVAA